MVRTAGHEEKRTPNEGRGAGVGADKKDLWLLLLWRKCFPERGEDQHDKNLTEYDQTSQTNLHLLLDDDDDDDDDDE